MSEQQDTAGIPIARINGHRLVEIPAQDSARADLIDALHELAAAEARLADSLDSAGERYTQPADACRLLGHRATLTARRLERTEHGHRPPR